MIHHRISQFLLLAALLFSLNACEGPAPEQQTAEEDHFVFAAPNPHPDEVENALPFSIGFKELQYAGKPPLPRVQAYVAAITQDNAHILVVGGRRQGLHTFKEAPAYNFIADSANNFIYVIDPKAGDVWSFDVDHLSSDLSAPLKSNNQQAYHDHETDIFYIAGGYGWKADTSDMVTFNTMIAFKVSEMAEAVKTGKPASAIEALIRMGKDDRWAVTGGELMMTGGTFYLVFGQKFMGQYRAFGGTDFTQSYTEEVRVFTLKPGQALSILSYGATTDTGPDRPFHRRDGNIIEDIDPATGQPRISAFGGVFKPGIIAPYDYPVYITGPEQPEVDTTAHQKFSQYGCPVISVYDSSGTNPTVYHTFFGGIGHYYYFQTPSQRAVYDTATNQGRNDGFPFVADITTFLQRADGTYDEWIHTQPIAGNRLLGTGVRFMPLPMLAQKGLATENNVIRLDKIPKGEKIFAGYIYGGIEALNPFPLVPNTGTSVTNSIFAVYIAHTPSPAIPAAQGHASEAFKTRLVKPE